MYGNHQINLIDIQVLHTEFRAIRVHRVIHSRIIDVNLNYGTTPSMVALDLYSVVDTIFKSLTIINWTNTAVFASEVNNATLIHLLLTTTTNFTTYTMNSFRGIVLYKCSNVTIGQSNFTNIPSFDTASDVAFQPAVVTLYYSEEEIVIRDCTFEANITALTVVQSKVRISGNINFTGNKAFRGAAMTFTKGGKMIVSEDSHITFKNECTKVQNPRRYACMPARILKSARATKVRVTGSIRKICRQKTETKEKEVRCLTLSRIPGSV